MGKKKVAVPFCFLHIFFVIVIIIQRATSFVAPTTDFFFDVDGISVSATHDHICALEHKHGTEIGGKARCWGFDDESGKLDPPSHVTFVQIVTGGTYGCGITLEQTVVCWGFFEGIHAPGLYNQITGTDWFVCGVRTDNTIFCWGVYISMCRVVYFIKHLQNLLFF